MPVRYLTAALVLLLVMACAIQTPKPESPAPATKTAGVPVARMSTKDVTAITAYHNKVRSDVGVGPLKWSPSLAAYAQAWADHLAGTSCQMQHRTEGKYGENLYRGTAGHYTAVDAAKAWETEKKLFRGGVLTRENWHPAGHYTQMVWRDTKVLGCGEAVCGKMLIVACNYDPPGNYIGRSPY